MNDDQSQAGNEPRKRRGRPRKSSGRGTKPEDAWLAELWTQAAKAGGSRDEVFQRTLVLALGLNPESEDHVYFANEIWLALGTWKKDEVPPPPIEGLTLRRVFEIARRLRDLNLKITRNATLAEKREYRRLAAAEEQPKKDEQIVLAVQAEMKSTASDDPLQGERGAKSRAARHLKMTPQNVGQRIKAHERMEADLRDAEATWTMITKLKDSKAR